MTELMRFENTEVKILEENKDIFFELYSTGMALGQARLNSVGVAYPRKDRIDENVKNAEITPCVRNGHKYLTESQLYDLMLEMRTDKCRKFRKWVTSEVLPSIRKTGKYEAKKESEPQYIKKFWNGEMVATLDDLSHFSNVSRSTYDYHIRKNPKKFIEGKDYWLLQGTQLMKFKLQNPLVSKYTGILLIVSKSGYLKLRKHISALAFHSVPCFVFESKDFHNEFYDQYKTNVPDLQGLSEKVERAKNYASSLVWMLDWFYDYNAPEDQEHYNEMAKQTALKLALEVSNITRVKYETIATGK